MSLPDAALDTQLDLIRLFNSEPGEPMAQMLLNRHDWTTVDEWGMHHGQKAGPTFARVFNQATTYAITERMMAVVAQGHRQLCDNPDPVQLSLDWLPTPSGFCWFATPFPLEMVAPKWETGARLLDPAQPKRPVHGVWWSTAPVGYYNEYQENTVGRGVLMGVVVESGHAFAEDVDLADVPWAYVPFDVTAWSSEVGWEIASWEEHEKAKLEGRTGVSTWSGASWRFLMTVVWSLLGGWVDAQPVSRATKRRAIRAIPSVDPAHFGQVRVVTLRRAKQAGHRTEGDPEDTGFEYSHQFVVSGHWRWQPYGPGSALRRYQWINPYVKGPEDKPLIVKDTVNVLKR